MFAEIAALAGGLHRREAVVNIGLEVIDIIEPDEKPQRQAARHRFGRGAITVAVAGE
ncbi:hypothetical protein [Bradyrhizobium sp. AUGA SZCCT0431]|uniref:hypothetical protein n=1 Tax=Bradyrhizobium sp. AUGA SZCCT0431 TaxID=2807674 RepID=UPI001BA79085|nr:hypothetical protein [Bradyrhizobium sp. AUGA SZCCT0431]MBR1145135.1 hypothetical protein [Bradyrhizobium sp. AUGA SZCCT0431]